MSTTLSARRRRRLAVGVVAGALLAVATPLAASAHVHVTPEEAPGNASTRLDFSFSHGCDGSPTTALVIDIPDVVDGVTPIVDGAWSIEVATGDDGVPTQVTYTALAPIDDHLAASVAMNVIFPGSAEGEQVPFPVTQICEAGETAWVEVAEDGQDPHDLDAPAPVVVVGGAADDDGHGHDHADETEATETAASDAATPEGDLVARWLAGGALVVGAAAVVLAVVRRRA